MSLEIQHIFLAQISEGGENESQFLRDGELNLTKFSQPSSALSEFVLDFRQIALFLN